MKWFKHQASSRNDEKIAALEDKAGLEGYGFYFKLLEVIAENMNETDLCSAEYSVNNWSKKINILPSKFKKLLGFCEETGLILVAKLEKSDEKLSKNRKEIYKVSSPNLLKYRDNHTKNLQAACKQEIDIDKEVNKEREKDKKTISPAVNTDIEKTKRKAAKSSIPNNFSISDSIRSWYTEQGYKENIDAHLVAFIDKAIANGYTYANWDSAFRNAIRDDWAGLRKGRQQKPAYNGQSRDWSDDYWRGRKVIG
jgi:Arc/MetJ-type ribon-helix-helix transcriptional regulator